MPFFCGTALGLAQIATLFTPNAAAGHSDYCLDFVATPPPKTHAASITQAATFSRPDSKTPIPPLGPPTWTIHGLWYIRLLSTHPRTQDANHLTTNMLPDPTTAMAHTANTATDTQTINAILTTNMLPGPTTATASTATNRDQHTNINAILTSYNAASLLASMERILESTPAATNESF